MHKVKIAGFEPSTEVTKLANKIIKDLKMIAPSQSFIGLDLSKTENTFSGSISIKSFQKTFSEELAGNDALFTLTSLLKKMKKQIASWKEVRFDNTPIPDKAHDASSYVPEANT